MESDHANANTTINIAGNEKFNAVNINSIAIPDHLESKIKELIERNISLERELAETRILVQLLTNKVKYG